VRLHAREYIRRLAAAGQHSFASADARQALGVSADAVKLALNRLIHAQLIASPARGFYVVVPPEYRALGCLPADQFIPALMERAGLAYYAGLLSAAQYHGAAHHRPQEFQVMLPRARRALQCGRVRVAFFVRKNLREVPVQNVNTPRGTISVSTPEATALDLVGYQHQVGGLNQVATLLFELAKRLDAQTLVAAAATAPLPSSQRLGYLLEIVGAAEKAAALKSYVKCTARQIAPLLSGAPTEGTRREPDWKLALNADVVAEF
jgi:predicted transcriptional regulator of viral defense system